MKLLIYFCLLFLTINKKCWAQDYKTVSQERFINQKDSIISALLRSKIDTAHYRCVYQESSGIYLFITGSKCYIYSKDMNRTDSLSDTSVFKIPFLVTIGEKKLEKLLKNTDSVYSALGSIHYFEKADHGCDLTLYVSFSSLIGNERTKKVGNGLFDLFGFAKIKLGYF